MDRIRIELMRGTFKRGQARLPLPRRELEIVATLALSRAPVGGAQLGDAIWPELDEQSARNALGVTLHRMRRRLGDAGAVSLTPSGYVLGGHVDVDLLEAERVARDLRGVGMLSQRAFEQARRTFAELSLSLNASALAASELRTAVERRRDDLVRAIGERLAAHALRSGELEQASRIAVDLLAYDACDESAWEIVIRTHVARDDRTGAIREFRRYTRVLADELGVPPSAHLSRLLQQVAGHV
jgi:DNA-binding SARP family transcriptional activator